MGLASWWFPAVFALNAGIGAILVYGVFAFMERHIATGAIGGVVIGTAVIYGEATLGERWFTVTVGEMKLLVLTAAAGAVIGVVATVLVFEPDL